MKTNFIDHSDIVLKKVGTASEDAIEKAGEMLVEAVQEKILYGYKDLHGNPPHTEILQTGRLFDSIDVKFVRDSQNSYSAMVGSNTTYAIHVHNGTCKLKGRPFITDALLESQDEINEILSSAIASGIE